MNLTELKEHYRVFKRDGKYHLYDKKEGSGRRSVFKYLASATRTKNGYAVDGYKPTQSVKKFNKQVEAKVMSYKYDSEYYDQNYRKGLFEEHIIYDYISELGFQMNMGGFLDIDCYTLYGKDLLGDKQPLLTLVMDGLRVIDDEPKSHVKITVHKGNNSSFLRGECLREVEDIKNQINSLVKPHLLHDSIENFNAQEIIPYGNGEINLDKLKSMFNIESKNFKAELKEHLIKLANTL